MDKKQVVTVWILIFRKDTRQYLAFRRAESKSFMPWAWEAMGGHVEFWEECEQAAIRECVEEIGRTIEPAEIVGSFSYMMDDGNIHATEIEYLSFLDAPYEININPKDHAEYRWVDLTEASMLYAQNPEVLRLITKAFERVVNY